MAVTCLYIRQLIKIPLEFNTVLLLPLTLCRSEFRGDEESDTGELCNIKFFLPVVSNYIHNTIYEENCGTPTHSYEFKFWFCH